MIHKKMFLNTETQTINIKDLKYDTHSKSVTLFEILLVLFNRIDFFQLSVHP